MAGSKLRGASARPSWPHRLLATPTSWPRPAQNKPPNLHPRTRSLLPDSLRCSETGARFMADMMSKHAMHAGGAEEVLYAGELLAFIATFVL